MAIFAHPLEKFRIGEHLVQGRLGVFSLGAIPEGRVGKAGCERINVEGRACAIPTAAVSRR
jgi:hypothetical protein